MGPVESERHPFSGVRHSRDAPEWYAHIDTMLFPALADHKVGEHVLFPGTGFIEIGLAVARAWLRSKDARIADLEFLTPLDLTNGETREIMSRVSPNSNTVEIFSRPRLSQASWLLHSRCKMLHGDTRAVVPAVPEHRVQQDLAGTRSTASAMPADCTMVRRSACSKARPSSMTLSFASSLAAAARTAISSLIRFASMPAATAS